MQLGPDFAVIVLHEGKRPGLFILYRNPATARTVANANGDQPRSCFAQ